MSDLPAPIRQLVLDSADLAADGTSPDLAAGYVLCLRTHTHTPMAPLGAAADGIVFDGKPRPGVTAKDLRLAERVEALWREVGGGGDGSGDGVKA